MEDSWFPWWKMNKTLSVFFLRWFVPVLLAVTFLFLPDLYIERTTSPLASNWIARIFFVIYLINPFIGIAKAVENEDIVTKDFEKYQFFSGDKDSLSIMTYLGAVFTVVSTSVVLLLAMRIFFPDFGILTYIFLLLYTVSVGAIALYGLKLYRQKNLI